MSSQNSLSTTAFLEEFNQPVEVTAPARLESTVQFAELDVWEAKNIVLVIPADEAEGGGYALNPEVLATLRNEIQSWLRALRERGIVVTELISISARDQSVQAITKKLLDVAYALPSRSWMTMFPMGRQVIIAPSSVVNSIGFDTVCRVAHESAIRTAQSSGKPYNVQAFHHYQSLKEREAA